MIYIAPDTRGHRIVRGVDTTITHRVYLEADESTPDIVQADCSAQVYGADGATVGSALPVTWTSGTATLSATVPDTDTSSETLTAGAWSVVWTVSGMDGEEQHARRARLVRRIVPPTLLSSELTSRYPELANLRTTAELRTGIRESYEDLTHDLDVRGVMLDQVTDPAWLHRAHYLRAAHDQYARAATDQQDDAFAGKAESLMKAYMAQMEQGIPYDEDQDGDEDTSQAQTSQSLFMHRTGRMS